MWVDKSMIGYMIYTQTIACKAAHYDAKTNQCNAIQLYSDATTQLRICKIHQLQHFQIHSTSWFERSCLPMNFWSNDVGFRTRVYHNRTKKKAQAGLLSEASWIQFLLVLLNPILKANIWLQNILDCQFWSPFFFGFLWEKSTFMSGAAEDVPEQSSWAISAGRRSIFFGDQWRRDMCCSYAMATILAIVLLSLFFSISEKGHFFSEQKHMWQGKRQTPSFQRCNLWSLKTSGRLKRVGCPQGASWNPNLASSATSWMGEMTWA